MMISRKRLASDVERWSALGWVTPEGKAALTRELLRGTGPTLATVLGTLASILFGFAAVSFIASHWEQIPRLMRLALTLGLMLGAYGLAGVFKSRDQRGFTDAALLFAILMFGGNVALVSQMFHIEGNPADFVLLWWITALVTGVALRSNPALAFAMILVCVWALIESGQRSEVYWPFLIGWALVAAAFAYQRWSPGIHLAGLALAIFVVSLGYTLWKPNAFGLVVSVGYVIALGSVAGDRLTRGYAMMWRAGAAYGLAIIFAGLFALQFIEAIKTDQLILLGSLTLATLLAAIWWGLETNNRGLLWLGYVGFSIEVMSLYVKTVGTLLGAAVLFFSAAVIVAALAYMAYRLHARQEARTS